MKKHLIYAFILLLPQVSLAADFCLNILCSDCTGYTEQYLRVKHVISSDTFSGYIQAKDKSFGVPAYIVLKGNNLLFSRMADNGKETYFYDADLATWNGTSATGIRHSVKYSLIDDVPYELLADKHLSLKLMSCPFKFTGPDLDLDLDLDLVDEGVQF